MDLPAAGIEGDLCRRVPFRIRDHWVPILPYLSPVVIKKRSRFIFHDFWGIGFNLGLFSPNQKAIFGKKSALGGNNVRHDICDGVF